jgi:3-hydroxyisobutyrate dehydrogenase-like beta-hydroxyacid dehydrogenase
VVKETGVPAPLLHLVGELFRHAHAVLGEEADHMEVIRLIERDAGVEIRG